MDPIVLLLLVKFAPWLVLAGSALVLARSPVGRALAQRIREGSATGADVAALAGELEQVRRELGELHERLDFAERVLAQQRGSLPPPGVSDHDSPTPPELAPAGSP